MCKAIYQKTSLGVRNVLGRVGEKTVSPHPGEDLSFGDLIVSIPVPRKFLPSLEDL